MKKWIVIALLAGLTLVSCHKTIIDDRGWMIYTIYTNDLEVDCVISWKNPNNLEEEASTRKVLPGGRYVQNQGTQAPRIWDDKGDCCPLAIATDLRITFGDGACFTLDQADYDFWKALPQYRRTVQDSKYGTTQEIYEIFLSDIHALAVKP